MLLALILDPVDRARAAVLAMPSEPAGGRGCCLPVRLGIWRHAAQLATRAAPAAERLAGARSAGPNRAADPERVVPSLLAVRTGYLGFRDERPNRVFCTCLLVLLAMMTLVTCRTTWA